MSWRQRAIDSGDVVPLTHRDLALIALVEELAQSLVLLAVESMDGHEKRYPQTSLMSWRHRLIGGMPSVTDLLVLECAVPEAVGQAQAAILGNGQIATGWDSDDVMTVHRWTDVRLRPHLALLRDRLRLTLTAASAIAEL